MQWIEREVLFQFHFNHWISEAAVRLNFPLVEFILLRFLMEKMVYISGHFFRDFLKLVLSVTIEYILFVQVSQKYQ